jgi:DNA modification methylase
MKTSLSPGDCTSAESVVLPKRFEHWQIDRLRPYEKNPRTHSPQQIAKLVASLREYGFTNPILVDSRDGIVAGHGRLEAARAIGMTEVPVVVLDHLSESQRRAYVIADNRLAMDAGWDEDLLAAELAGLKIDGFDLGLTGFGDDEIDAIFAAADSTLDGEVDEEEVPALPVSPVSRPGDVWLLGRHRVLCGDATVPADVERLMAGRLANCLWTDPPYNVAYEGSAGTIQNDDLDPAAFAAFLAGAFGNAIASIQPGAAAYISHAETEGLAFRKAFIEAGFKLSSCLIWRKNSLVLGRSDWQWAHEPILYGWKPGAAHSWYGGRDKITVLDENKPSRNAEHPTMKPVALVERMVVNSTKPGQVVLDLFGGSGSTLMACERTARTARLLELDARFIDVIVRRWEGYTGKDAVLEDTGESFADIRIARAKEAA